ncbi:MAG: zinc ABC transporter substrate-binding protein [Prochloraceae cyanobacterium]|nr:zinc ABC transporter substrate-binding protein [Prochloraceae cyanobacterium]
MKRKNWWVVGGMIIAVAIASCQSRSPIETSEGDRKPKVVTTTTIIADLTERVAGDEIELKSILKAGDDPHIYEPVPRDSIALERADLILYNGYNLEPGIIKLIQAAGVEGKKFAVAEIVKPLDFEYQGQKVPDPHVWGDVENSILMVNAIRDRLIEIAPEDRAEFTENAAALVAELKLLDAWIESQIETIPENNRKLVTTHDAFEYYANAYGLDVLGTLIGISTEEKPSAKTVENLIEAVKKSKVPTIFAETTINPRLIATVAEEAKVKLGDRELYADSIGSPGSDADTYIKMLVTNTRTVVEGLGGKYTPFDRAKVELDLEKSTK